MRVLCSGMRSFLTSEDIADVHRVAAQLGREGVCGRDHKGVGERFTNSRVGETD